MIGLKEEEKLKESGDIIRVSASSNHDEGISSSTGRHLAIMLVAGVVLLMAVIATLSYVYIGARSVVAVAAIGIILGRSVMDTTEKAMRHDIRIPGPHVRTDTLVISRGTNMFDEKGMRISRTAEFSWQEEDGERKREERTLARVFIPWNDIVSVGYAGGLAHIRFSRCNIVDPDRGRNESVIFSIPGESPEKAFVILLAEIAMRNSGIRNAVRKKAESVMREKWE